ncbi:MAG: right-handed parallel beta-helix repeat-containing protein, partial [bacterium]|nr:right-handed parallel beta-helix repeat-containing protein [bacterium]
MKTICLAAFALAIYPMVAQCGAFQRHLPEAYIPGRPLTVTLEPTGSYWDPSFQLYETIPPGWTFRGSSDARFLFFDFFDPLTQTIHWTIDFADVYIQVPPPPLVPSVIPTIRYQVTPPPDRTSEVTFDGYDGAGTLVVMIGDECFWGPDPDPADNPTTGDTTIPGRAGAVRRVPRDYPGIQAALDACVFGDTVLVSGKGAPYAEDVRTKQGVDVVGCPTSPPPELKGRDTGILAAPDTRIRGIHISCGRIGVLGGHAAEISNCVITGTTEAAIEYLGATEGKITNCTIVDNGGVGVLCHEPSPNVVVSNSILVGNAGKDVENCTVRFCLLEDDIEPGYGENNISADPMFANAAEGDYRLLRTSPCIDAGDNTGIAPEAVDILSKPRIL